MTAAARGERLARLSLTDWPQADADVWKAACNPPPGPFSPWRRSAATYRMYSQAYGGFLWHLKSQGDLEPTETPAERVTLGRLGSYYAHVVGSDCADYTITNRFDGLRGALRLMYPNDDFSFITKPGLVSIRQSLPMARQMRFVPDSRHAELWAETLFNEALTLSDPSRRRLQIRDAAFIGIMASRAPRLRAVAGMRLDRNLRRTQDGWKLFFQESLMKGGRSSLELQLDERVSTIIDRYIAVERIELLGDQTHDAVWVAHRGHPLTEKGFDFMIRTRTKAQFGVAFGSHRFRTSLTTTQALVDGKNILGTSAILAHSPAVALKHYNRAGALAASLRYDAQINTAEDAAAALLGLD